MFRLPRFLSLIPSSKLQAPTIKTSDEGRGNAFMFRLPGFSINYHNSSSNYSGYLLDLSYNHCYNYP